MFFNPVDNNAAPGNRKEQWGAKNEARGLEQLCTTRIQAVAPCPCASQESDVMWGCRWLIRITGLVLGHLKARSLKSLSAVGD